MKYLKILLVVIFVIALSSCKKAASTTSVTAPITAPVGAININSGNTPDYALKSYCECLKKGDSKTLNTVFTDKWISKYGKIKEFGPQNIYGIKVRVDNAGAKKPPNSDTAFYKLDFIVKDGDFIFGTFIKGEANYCYYTVMKKEKGVWKIDYISTTPNSVK